jgi:hypothetical protein
MILNNNNNKKIKKNEILLFADNSRTSSKVKLARFRKTEVTCFLSYVQDRANTNTSIIAYTLSIYRTSFQKGDY